MTDHAEWTTHEIAGYEIRMTEVGDSVIVFDPSMSPIAVKDSEARFYPYEARRVAELLMRPNAHDIGEQLLKAADIVEEAHRD